MDVRLTPDYKKALDTLHVLASDLQKKGVRTALRAAGKPIQEAMQTIAPDDEKTAGSRLKSAINITVARAGRKVRTGVGDRVVTPQEAETALLVGPNKKVLSPSFNKKINVGFIGWFAEKGTKAHMIGVVRNLKLRNRLEKAGIKTTRKYGLVPILKFGGRFATGPIPHPGTKALGWQAAALSSAQSQVEGLFYESLTKWVAKHGR
jgi:hypothetical protein